MHTPAGTSEPAPHPFLVFGATRTGTVLVNIRFWVATVIGLALLVAAGAAAANGAGLGMTFVWLTFTILWVFWASIVSMSPGYSRSRPAPPTPDHRQAWRGDHIITPLTPEQQAWVDKQKQKGAAPAGAADIAAPAKPVPARRPAAAKKPSKAQPRPAAPGKQPYGVDHQGAERLAAEWMRHLGVLDAKATRHVQDNGIDVDSARFVAQVKHLSGGVGAPDLNRLAGVAGVARKHGLFFANTYYTPQAVSFAEQAQVALFRYDAQAGSLHGENALAQKAINSGDLSSAFPR